MDVPETGRTMGGNELPTVQVREAPLIRFPGADNPEMGHFGVTDCNSPAHWDGATLFVFNSSAHPWRNAGHDLFRLTESHQPVRFDTEMSGGRWFESTWKDEDGTLYGWYHNEPAGICPERLPEKRLTAPRIGAARSADNGATWQDLGIILEAPPGSLRCNTENYYFAGGNGDFSVIFDPPSRSFYFFVGAYHAAVSEQGIAVARMRFADRDDPVGNVWKWHEERWQEPGIGGHVTPIFPAARDWHARDADVFWGPAVHWNTHLERCIMLLNRAQDGNWRQEGIYVTFSPDPGSPTSWSPPAKLLGREEVVRDPATEHGWYPQVMGTEPAKQETDTLAGRVARLFVHGQSRWEILFSRPGERG
jgi:hypothetical protein